MGVAVLVAVVPFGLSGGWCEVEWRVECRVEGRLESRVGSRIQREVECGNAKRSVWTVESGVEFADWSVEKDMCEERTGKWIGNDWKVLQWSVERN